MSIDLKLGRGALTWYCCSVWVQQTDLRAAEKADRLENELNGYKTNLLKEAIRVGHTDLADFYFSRGDLQVCAVLLLGCCSAS